LSCSSVSAARYGGNVPAIGRIRSSSLGQVTSRLRDHDARLRVIRQIVARRGQKAFRVMVLDACGDGCVITDCDAGSALEAAHLQSYRGADSNVISNGLLLRADIHTLFDLGLLAIDPVTRQVAVPKLLAATPVRNTRRPRPGRPGRTVAAPGHKDPRGVVAGLRQGGARAVTPRKKAHVHRAFCAVTISQHGPALSRRNVEYGMS